MARVLIVEDDDGIATILRELVMLRDNEVDVVGDARDAITYLHRRTPDLLIVDWTLPNAPSSEAFLQEIRRVVPSVPLILCSGSHKAASRAKAVGASEFLPKPFSADALFALLDLYLR